MQDGHSGQPVKAAKAAFEHFVKGYYTSAQKSKFDFQDDPATAKGLPVAMRDAFDNEATIEYDGYKLLPLKVTDPVGMVTRSEYDYRILQPDRVTDPNQNVSTFAFTPLGLMHKTALLGKDDGTEGDTLTDPGVLLEYDLFAFANSGEPVWVKTSQRQHHIHADYLSTLPAAEQNATIVAVEYSDGFGRQLQTRTQAEDLLFGNAELGDSGLPADQTATNAPAVGTLRDTNDPLNVVVSGAKLYNNKGKVVEQWEPYFGSGFDLTDADVQHGQRVRIYFDALGRPQRTVNPDDTEQRVVYGVPNALNTPNAFAPSPWERYTYDALDLAPITHPTLPAAASDFTPKSELIDALGRTVKTTEHAAHFNGTTYEDVVMQYAYDIKGQLLEVTDPLGRVNFQHKYDTAGNNLWSEHLDSGVRTSIVDAQGKPLYGNDAKGARVYTSYDRLSRPTGVWARNKSLEPFTRRQTLIYGDQPGQVPPGARNFKGRLFKHYDEAGKVQVQGYDFKGNPLEKTRWVIRDDQAQPLFVHVVDWTLLDESILDLKTYTSTLAYDALNRVREAMYPEDVNGDRAVSTPKYNRAGALLSIWQDGLPYVWEIAYNAKGQRLLLSLANEVMTRYTYDPLNFRLLRIRSEKFTRIGFNTLDPAGGVQQDLAYQYDLGGNITGIHDKAPANGSAQGPGDLLKQFEYDPLKRLLSATGRESTAPSGLPLWDAGIRAHDYTATNTYTRAYRYDKVGNVLREQHTADGHAANSFTKLFNYPTTGAPNRLESFEVGTYTFPFTYDAVGNQLTEITSRKHQWDHSDQLKYFMVQAGGGSSPPSVWAHYFYADGTRVKKIVSKIVGGSTIQEVTVYIDGVFEETYVRAVGGSIDPNRHYNTLHVMDGRSRIATIRVGTDVEDPTPDTKFNLEDHLGTSSVTLDYSGDLINREEYYPFGETCFGAFAKKRFRYCGKEKDSESGLYFYGARLYSAWTCRFISVDPLADSYAHLNPYNYAGNKPIGDVDIDGLQGSGESTSEFPMNPTDASGNTVPIELKEFEVTATQNLDVGGSQGGNSSTMPYSPLIPDILVEKGSIWEHTVALLNGVKDVVNLVPQTWNSGVANVEALQRGTWTQDMTSELSGMAEGTYDFLSRETEYATSTPILEQFTDLGNLLMSPEAARFTGSMLAPLPLRGVVSKLAVTTERATVTATIEAAAPGLRTVEQAGLTTGQARRIQNAANRIEQEITLVGSRANGTAGAMSDWDYVIPTLTKRTKDAIKNSLPGAGELDMPWRNIDFFKGTVDPNRSHVPFTPKKP